MTQTEKNYEKMKTSEIIDLLDTDKISDTELDVVWTELSKRDVMNYIQEQFNEYDNKIEGMQKAINKLKAHKHDNITGDCMVKL